ncbi:MAG: hypothetical protein ACRD2L_21240, partial [Terriglobia bacterium]
ILPMTVLRRLDAVLEPSKPGVLDMKVALDKAGITNQDKALRQAAGGNGIVGRCVTFGAVTKLPGFSMIHLLSLQNRKNDLRLSSFF